MRSLRRGDSPPGDLRARERSLDERTCAVRELLRARAPRTGRRRGSGGEARRLLRAAEDAAERDYEALAIRAPHEEAVLAVLHEVGHAADVGRDDGTAPAERLHHDPRQPLRLGGEDEAGRRVEEVRDLVAGEPLTPRHRALGALDEALDRPGRVTAADEDEARVRVRLLHLGPGSAQRAQALVRLEHPAKYSPPGPRQAAGLPT